jgi:hypothetical protein
VLDLAASATECFIPVQMPDGNQIKDLAVFATLGRLGALANPGKRIYGDKSSGRRRPQLTDSAFPRRRSSVGPPF